MASGHPGEEYGRPGLYVRHRVITLAGYGLGAAFISEDVGLPLGVVEQVIHEEGAFIELEEERPREW